MKKIHIALFFALSVLFFLTSCFIRNSMLAVFSEPVENATVLINSTEQTTPYAALFKSGSNITLEVPEFQRHDLNEKIAGEDAEYSFESWSDGKQERKRELKIDNDSEELTFKLFAKFKVEIALNVPLTDDATIVYSEWHDYGSEVKFEAPLIPGYEFSHWEVESGSTYFFNQQSAGIRMVIYYPTLITAHYMEIETFRINTVALPPEGGITSGDGHYRKNEIATLEATPSYGYSFHNWSLNGEVVSTNSNYSFEVTEDSTYVASFSKKIYIISASSGNGGTIDPYGEIQVIHGESITFDISAADGYEIDDVLVDGSSVGKVSGYTFDNVTSDHTIEATFKKKTYTIVATAGSGGSISPSGNVVVEHGTSKSFTITPDSGYFISDVLVDGESIGPKTSYTFQNITSSHTIHALFEETPPPVFNVTFVVSSESAPVSGATVSFNGEQIATGIDGTVTFTGVIPGNDKPYTVSKTGYQGKSGFVDVIDRDVTVNVELSRGSYTIVATAGSGGSISPSGNVVVKHGSSKSFTITPDSGYEIDDVLVDGSSVGKVSSYTFNNVTSDHTIEATFKKKTYTIVATAGSGGSISPSGNVVVEHGASKSFTITPDSGYEIDDVLVDGSSIGKVSSYTFNNVTSNHTIEATFKKKTYTIVATAGSGGSISPSGNVVVEHGASKSFTITPDSGYFISDVLVDGESIGPKTGYTFQNITSSHTIHALFEETPPPVFNVTFVVSSESAPVSGATVSFNGEQLATGIDGTVTFTGVIPGNDKPYTVSKTGYQSKSGFVDVIDRDVTVNVELSRGSYTIVATAGSGGSISPSGNVVVEHGSSKSFTITPDSGCEIDDVLVDGSSVGKVSSYTFNNVTSDHTIEATFKKKTYTIVATAGSGGSISPSGNVVVEHGASKSFTITPDSGCEIDDVLVDGSSIGKVSGYTFDNVTSNHTIEAAFKKKTYTIVATAGSGGSISPSGNVVVEHGSSKSFTITPDSGYEIDDVLVDGSSVGKVSSYTFDNVTSDHTIEATFKKKTYTVSLSVNLPDSGILTGEGEYYHGETVNISAAANQGFKFVNWTENSTVVSESSDYSFVVTSDRSFTANFIEVFSVTFIVSDNDGFVQGASVEFNGETKTTDANGRAMFEQVVPGNDLPYAVKKGGYSDYSGTLDVVESNVEEYVTLAKAAPTLIIDDSEAIANNDVWISIRAKDIESISAIRIVIQFDPAYFTWSQSTSSIQFIEPLALDPTGILIWGSKMPEDLKDEIIDFSVALDHVADLSGEQEILRVKLKAKSITGQSTLHLAEYTATTGVKVRNQIIDKNGKDLGPMQLVPGVITINQ